MKNYNNGEEIKVGDKVKHGSRSSHYQRGVVTKIQDGCNGSIEIFFEDGCLGANEESTLCPQDLTKIK